MTGSEAAVPAAIAAGVVVGLQIAKAGADFALTRFKNGKNGKNGKPGFNPDACTDREARIRVLESQHDTPTGYNPAQCQEHGEAIATLTEKIHSRLGSVDRRIGELRDGVKDIADRMPAKR